MTESTLSVSRMFHFNEPPAEQEAVSTETVPESVEEAAENVEAPDDEPVQKTRKRSTTKKKSSRK